MRDRFKQSTSIWTCQGRSIGFVVLLCSALLSGCQTYLPDDLSNDPLQPVNRVVYGINRAFDKNVVLPVAWFYLVQTPRPIRSSIRNFLDNLSLPTTFANDLFQGEFGPAGTAFGRFAVNSTAGIGGAFDVATDVGLPFHHSDFGETLSRFGVGEGPFLVLPILGPDNLRDFSGQIFDLSIDPFTYFPLHSTLSDAIYWNVSRGIVRTLDNRASSILLTEYLNGDASDEYVTMRSIYRQSRANEINRRKPDPFEDLPPVP
jgi:phospholipid-binding lipoprotein MlaA